MAMKGTDSIVPSNPMPFDGLPKATWVCMRDWNTNEQKMCGIGRHELACFGVTEAFDFHYGGTNSLRQLVSMEKYTMGLEKGMTYALHGERVMANLAVPVADLVAKSCFLIDDVVGDIRES